MSTARKPSSSEPTLKDNIVNYFKGVKVEWAKITWPERKQVIVEVIIVIIVVFFFTLLVFTYDNIFGFLLKLLESIPNG